ncbi:importin-5-like [Anaeramoeba flamelloides]|uniref:Importin-5-like n=1 Tax=Anaeramoeba flamelloides TaxID=1746091 RepID=A0ABQ8YD26_9EUKA|nr:importin-5-like [Anaeramoeba flamelloides]
MDPKEEFEQMLKIILSPNNEERKKAEFLYQEFASNETLLCIDLHLQMLSSESLQIQTLTLVLLRQLISKMDRTNELFSSIETFEPLKDELFKQLNENYSKYLKKRVCDVITSLLIKVELEKFCPNMIEILEKYASQDFVSAEIAMYLLSKLLVIERDSMLKESEKIFSMLLLFISDKVDSVSLRIAALNACGYFLICFKYEQDLQVFEPIFESCVSLLGNLIENDEDEDIISMVIQELIEMLEYAPRLWKPYLVAILQHLFPIAKKDESSREIQSISIEFMCVLVEQGSGMAIKIENFVEELLSLLVKVLTNIEDLSEKPEIWGNMSEDEYYYVSLGEDALIRVCSVLGGKNVLETLFLIIPEYLKSNDFEKRFAALRTLSSIGKSSHDLMVTKITEITEMVLDSFQDKYPQNRFQCCQTIEKLLKDFPNSLQDQFSQEILSGLVLLLDETIIPLQLQSCKAIWQFVEDSTREIIEPYADDLMHKLLQILEINDISLQSTIIPTISSIAITIGSLFEGYYQTLMPTLKNIFQNTQKNRNKILISKVIECISMIGRSVGAKIFHDDAYEVMEMIFKFMEIESETLTETEKSYIYHSWYHISSSLKEEFIPFLEYAMPYILESSKKKIQIINLKKKKKKRNINNFEPQNESDQDYSSDESSDEFSDETDDSSDDENNDFEETLYQGETITIRSSEIEEKSDAIWLIYYFAKIIPNDYFLYAEESLEIILNALVEPLSKTIRLYSSMAMPQLINVYLIAYQNEDIKEINKETITNLIKNILLNLLEIICIADDDENDDEFNFENENESKKGKGNEKGKGGENENEDEDEDEDQYVNNYQDINVKDVRYILDSINEIMKFSKNLIDSEVFNDYILQVPFILEQSVIRRKILEEEQKDQDLRGIEDDLRFKRGVQKENILNNSIVESFGPLFQYHKSIFLKFFDTQLFEYYSEIIKPKFSKYENHLGIKTFTILIENCPTIELFQHYWQYIGDYVYDSILSEDLDLRQTVVYSVGAFAQYGGDYFAKFAHKFAINLIKSIGLYYDSILNQNEKLEKKLKKKELFVYDFSVEALGKMCFYQQKAIDYNEFLNFWFRCLPIKTKKKQIIRTYGLLCSFIEMDEEIILGENGKNLNKIIQLFAQIINTKYSPIKLSNRIHTIILKIKESCGNEQFEKLLLSIDNQNLINIIVEFISNK